MRVIRWVFIFGLAWAQDLLLRRAPRAKTPPPTISTEQVRWLKGRVVDAQRNEPLVGAYVRIPGTVLGAVTDAQGEFRIPTTLQDPVTVEVSYVGYQTQQVTLRPQAESGKPEVIRLSETPVLTQEVVIAASRVEERFLESPVQIMPLSRLSIQTSPALFSAQTAGFLPGVEVIHTSLTFPVVNARGFTNTQNGRFIQRVDGVERLSVALSVPVWIFTGPADIDVANTEVVVGPASSLYGPNAFNGAMLTTLKTPFAHPGFSAQARLGLNYIDQGPKPLYELQLRYATVWKNRLGLKVVLQGLQAQDWIAKDTTDRGVYEGAQPPYDQPGSANPGYVPINGYGQDARILVSGFPLASGGRAPAFYLSRTGYMENELVSPYTYALKFHGEATYRLSERLQAKVGYHFAQGQTIFQTHLRYLLKGFAYHLGYGELSSATGFLRFYYIRELGGRTSALNVLGANLLNHLKPHRNWFVQYLLAYGGYLDLFISPEDRAAFIAHYGRPVPTEGDHAAARQLADSDTRFLSQLSSVNFLPLLFSATWEGLGRLSPNDPLLKRLADSLLRIPVTKGGGQLVSRSGIYHAEAQQEFTLPGAVQFILGGSFRLFELNSEGTVFIDSAGRPVYNWEAGAYGQLRRSFLDSRLTLTAGLRYDYRQYLVGVFTPRIAASYRLDPKGQHILRAAYQTAFRNPVIDALFIRLQGDVLLIGALPQLDRQYGIAGLNNYTVASVQAYREARARGASPEEAARLLVSLPINGLRPERLSSIEIGSRHLFWSNRVLIDLTYAYQRYRDFHGNVLLYGPADPQATLSPQDVENNRLSPAYSRYYNVPGTPQAHFLTLSLQYRLNRYLLLTTNYNYAQASGLEEARRLAPGLIVFFNTPLHRVNTGIILQGAGRWNAQIWHQWVPAYLYQRLTYSRIVPTYNLLHAQVSYRLPRLHSEIRLGAQNLLNFYHIQTAGGPSIGGLYYIQYAFDPLSL
ncbi:MAG: carboxypeptidase-like regulatory domain-containing protein [Bacteroidia bacterium]